MKTTRKSRGTQQNKNENKLNNNRKSTGKQTKINQNSNVHSTTAHK